MLTLFIASALCILGAALLPRLFWALGWSHGSAPSTRRARKRTRPAVSPAP